MRIGIHIHWFSRWRPLNIYAARDGLKYIRVRACRCGKTERSWVRCQSREWRYV
jgi:hypothetical protein